MNPRHYRTRLLRDVCRIIVLPVVLVWQLLRVAGYHPRFVLSVPCYFLSILTWGWMRNVYYDFYQARDARRLGAKLVPRIKGKWPGNVDLLLRMMKAFKTSYILDVYLKLFQEYGSTTLNTRIFWVDQIITMDEEHQKYVLSTGFNHFWRGFYQKERMEKFLGDGIFNRDEDKWRMHRSVARPFFARERISDFQTFEKHTALTLSVLADITSGNQACDAQDLYCRFTLDTASEFLFGNNLDTLSGSLPKPGSARMGPKGSATDDEIGTFSHAFELAQCIITSRARLGYFWPLTELFKNKMVGPSMVTKRWIDPIVKRALEEKESLRKNGTLSPVAERTFLQHLAESTDDVGLIRDELLSILLASRDTTSCTLTFVTYFMAIYPEVAKKMRAEVLEHHGLNEAPTYESIRKLKYMRAVINETLRLFPPVPLNIRESRPEAATVLPPSRQAKDDFVPAPKEPLYMPAKTPIMFMSLLVQRNPDLWGLDADEFDPERWLDPDRLKIITSNPMMFIPFSAGPRICLGQNFAYNEASYFLVRLLQQYDSFALAPDVQPVGSLPPSHWKQGRGRQAVERCWPAAALTLYSKGGMWVRFGKAQGQS